LAQHCFTLESKLFAYERELHEAHARIAELEVGCVRAWLWCFFPRRRAQSAHSAVRQRRTLLCGVAARRCPLWACVARAQNHVQRRGLGPLLRTCAALTVRWRAGSGVDGRGG